MCKLVRNYVRNLKKNWKELSGEEVIMKSEIKRSVCPYDCPDACGLLVEVESFIPHREST